MIEESQTLADELARASAIESLPPMLQALMRAALGELQAWHDGRSTRGLAVARHAVAEWRRWLATR